jgi:WD40 repeat protein/predicted Ser/Thr protein kinase
MSDGSANRANSAPARLARLARLDSICDHFEAAWKAGQRPQLEHYLDQTPPAERFEVLRELLALELSYRGQNGEHPQLDEYLQRFPPHADLIDTVFTEVGQATPRESKAAPWPSQPEIADTAVGTQLRNRNGAKAAKVLGDYELLDQLGKGGMGVVYRAHQRSANRIVALKVIRPDLLEQFSASERRDWLERFRREAQIAAALEHDCVVTVYEIGQADGQHFYSMRFVEGQSLAEILRKGPAPAQLAAKYLEQVARAVHALHLRGIVHRDLKPRNILVDANDRPFVTDFGLAKWSQYTQELTHLGACVGTPEYMAPEQYRNPTGVRAAADIYSLGATLYALLTGRPPFQSADEAETVRQVREDEPLSPRRLNLAVHRDLALICLKCLEKEPRKRYASAEQMAEELWRYRHGEPLRHTRAVSMPERVWRWCRRKPAMAAVSGVALVAVSLAVSFAIYQARARMNYQAEVIRTQQVQLAEAALDQAIAQCMDRKIPEGILWLARSLERAPADPPDVNLDRVIRIHLAGWSRRLSPVLPHDRAVLAVSFSRDGKTFFTATAEKVQLWETATTKPIGQPVALPQGVRVVAFSLDGKTILTGNADHTARLLDAATGQAIGQPLRHEGKVWAVAFSPDSKTVVTGSDDQTAQLWDAATGQAIGERLQHEGRLRAVCFSPDGRTLVTGSGTGNGQKGEARLWDTVTGRLIREPLPHSRPVLAVAFSPDGKAIVTGGGGTAQVWNTVDGQRIGERLQHNKGVSAVAFCADGKRVLTGSDKIARLWDVDTGRAVELPVYHRGTINSLAFSPNGKIILTGSTDYTARLCEAAVTEYHRASLPHTGIVSAVAFSHDGRLLVTGSQDRNATTVWDVATGSERARFAHQCWVWAVAFSPDRKSVLTGGGTPPMGTSPGVGEACLWDVATGTSLVLPHQEPVWAVAFSPDGKTALTGSLDGNARLWDTGTGQLLGVLPHGGPVYSVSFRYDGKIIVTASRDGTARVWDAANGQPIGAPLRHAAAVYAAVLNSNGTLLLTGSDDKTAQLWDTIPGTPHGAPLQHQDSIHGVAFSPNDRLIVTGSDDKSARLWNTLTSSPAGPPLQHHGRVSSVAFSPDGWLVLTASADKTAQLWDVATGRRYGPPLAHSHLLGRAAFSPDGKTVVTRGTDRIARLWDVPVPVAGTVERIVLWTKVITGMELDNFGVVQLLDFKRWDQCRERLEELGGAP